MAKKSQSAHDAFLENFTEALSKINAIKVKLETAAMIEATDKFNWSYAADLAKINGQLDEISDSLTT